MEPISKEHDFLAVLRHVMPHGVITLLAVAIAFATPDAARFILYVWWPRVELDANQLLATEIVLASTLMVLFHLCKRAWDTAGSMTSPPPTWSSGMRPLATRPCVLRSDSPSMAAA